MTRSAGSNDDTTDATGATIKGVSKTARSWRSLTSTLDDPSNPPRQLLYELLDATPGRVRATQRSYRDSAGPLLVPGSSVNPGTLGTAFDVWVQLRLDPNVALNVAVQGASYVGDDMLNTFQILRGTLRERSAPDEPVREERADALGLQLAWVAALFTEVHRTGDIWPGSALDFDEQIESPEQLLKLVPPQAVEDLRGLAAVAEERLLPRLLDLSARGPVVSGPTFTGSRLMPADADLVVGRTVVELKTQLGGKHDGGRRLTLSRAVLHQLLGYVLHDHDDRFGLHHIAIYQARYGHFAQWSIGDLIGSPDDEGVDMVALRARWLDLLRSDPPC